MKRLNKKSFQCVLFAFVAMILCLGMLSMRVKADTPGTVIDDKVNIRKSADKTSESLGHVNSGDKVTIIEEQKNAANEVWYKITTSSGTTGYVRSDFIKKTDSTTTTTNNNTNTNTNNTTSTTKVTDTDKKSAYITGDTVNIRSDASSKSDKVASANKNTEVTVVGEATGSDGYKWYKVSFSANGATKTGFIRSDLLTFTKPTNTPAETNIDSNTNKKDDTNKDDDKTTTDTDTQAEEPEPEPDPTPAPTAEKKKTVTPVKPFEDPAVIPDGFTEAQLPTGEKVWSKGDYVILYGTNEDEVTGWYVLDQKNNSYISFEGFLDGTGKKKGSDDKLFGIISSKVVIVILVVIIILLLGALFFLALKLSRGVEDDDDYEYDDYEDEDEEEDIPVSSIENSRGSSRKKNVHYEIEEEPKPKKSGKAKDKFLNYFTAEDEDDSDEEYYDDVDDDDDIDFIDI